MLNRRIAILVVFGQKTLAKVLVINDVYKVNDEIFEGKREHPVDCLIVFGA